MIRSARTCVGVRLSATCTGTVVIRWRRRHRRRSPQPRRRRHCSGNALAQGRAGMTNEPSTIRVFIPLTYKKRNGRPRILPPESEETLSARRQDPHILRALGRAWAWRRRQLESGEATTLQDIARAEKVTDRYVSGSCDWRICPPTCSNACCSGGSRRPSRDLIKASYLPWAEQMGWVFDRRPSISKEDTLVP
jgi:hypothetical protein